MVANADPLTIQEPHGNPPIIFSDPAPDLIELPVAPHLAQSDHTEYGTGLWKKIIVCCDGTTNSDIKRRPITNVARLARCITSKDRQGVPQVVLYQKGIGAGTSKWANTIEGATGRGLVENVLEAYGFICHNYDTQEDQVHLIGFSRGAFTVRSIAQLMADVGLLTKRGLQYLQPLFEMWREGHKDSMRQKVAKIAAMGDSRLGVRVKTCAVWDTVGSLGLPMVGFIPQPAPRRLKFINSSLCPNIDNAIQALSLYEHRRHFQAIVWKKPEGTHQKLKQCWFLGFHSDIGGGNKDEALSYLAMLWMVDQMQEHLNFEIRNLSDDSSEQKMTDFSHTRVIDFWSVGINILGFGVSASYERILKGLHLKIKESMKGIFVLAGSKIRRPCLYFWDEGGMKKVNSPNADTGQEEIHFSVRALLADRCVRPCTALKFADARIDNGQATWILRTEKSGNSYEVPEAKASHDEIALLRSWIEAELFHRQDRTKHSHEGRLLFAFLEMLPQGLAPSKTWSEASYQKDIAWKRVVKAEIPVAKIPGLEMSANMNVAATAVV